MRLAVPICWIAASVLHAVYELRGLGCATRFRGRVGAGLLQRRGSLIVRRLSRLLGPRQVLCALAAALEDEPDLRFAAALVQALNLILLTAPEVTTHP